VEGFHQKIKRLKRLRYGRAWLGLLRARILHARGEPRAPEDSGNHAGGVGVRRMLKPMARGVRRRALGGPSPNLHHRQKGLTKYRQGHTGSSGTVWAALTSHRRFARLGAQAMTGRKTGQAASRDW